MSEGAGHVPACAAEHKAAKAGELLWVPDQGVCRGEVLHLGSTLNTLSTCILFTIVTHVWTRLRPVAVGLCEGGDALQHLQGMC